MKLFVCSDIHGSAFYAKKCVDAFMREGAEKMVILGDVLYHGPRNPLPKDYDPMGVAAALNKIKTKIICIRGNCDSAVDQMVLEFPIIISRAVLFFGGKTILAAHGDELSDLDFDSFDVVLSGHTHVPRCLRRAYAFWLNPGSASLPKENSDCGYLVLSDNGSAVWKNFDGTIIDEASIK